MRQVKSNSHDYVNRLAKMLRCGSNSNLQEKNMYYVTRLIAWKQWKNLNCFSLCKTLNFNKRTLYACRWSKRFSSRVSGCLAVFNCWQLVFRNLILEGVSVSYIIGRRCGVLEVYVGSRVWTNDSFASVRVALNSLFTIRLLCWIFANFIVEMHETTGEMVYFLKDV